MDLGDSVTNFAKEVGGVDDGPVTCVGGRTQWEVGGSVHASAREVLAPSGVVEFEPAEMVVRVRAGTTVAELSEVLGSRGQQVPLDPASPEEATVGGVLAVGRSGLRRLRYGHVRDLVLEVRMVTADGKLVKAGGPVVKNVSGYDLNRVFVGSLGTLGFVGEVVLRCLPKPPVATWLRSPAGADPFAARDRLFRPSSLLWDGTTAWVLLEGHAADVAAERAALGTEWFEVEGPPVLPAAGRRSVRPSELRDLQGSSFVAEVGVGTIHLGGAIAPARPEPSVVAINQRLKDAFDPTCRLNPGRTP